jgi:hypothetical protein
VYAAFHPATHELVLTTDGGRNRVVLEPAVVGALLGYLGLWPHFRQSFELIVSELRKVYPPGEEDGHP